MEWFSSIGSKMVDLNEGCDDSGVEDWKKPLEHLNPGPLEPFLPTNWEANHYFAV